MDVNGIARLATAVTHEQTREEVGMAVLKKALDVSASSAAALIASAAPAAEPASRLPSHLGRNIDTTA